MKIYLAFLLLVILSNLSYADDFAETLKLAEQGDAYSQHNLGYMYASGEGVPKNDKTAVMWYTKAAKQGDADAQADLGRMYIMGEGATESVVMAYVWLAMAKIEGHDIAPQLIVMLKELMTKEQIAKAQELAAKCYESDYKDCN
jgi:TPR repeat protein